MKINKKEYWIKEKHQKAQIILPLIEKILKKYKIQFSQLSAIEVNTGPGSFTGVRVGVSIANALGFALKVPINGKKVGDQVTPLYTEGK